MDMERTRRLLALGQRSATQNSFLQQGRYRQGEPPAQSHWTQTFVRCQEGRFAYQELMNHLPEDELRVGSDWLDD